MPWIILMFVLLIASIKPVTKHQNLSVSVIIPAYNEEKTVAHVVKVVKSLNYIKEIIVVDDGSSDLTAINAKEAGATVINHIKNRGKGAAIKTGFKNSKGDIVVFLDGDLKNLTNTQVNNIISPIMNGEADITKTKFKREGGRVTELTAKPLLNFFFPEVKFVQPLSGQFAAKRSFLNKIEMEDDYGVDVGIVLDADVMGMKVKEVDIGEIDHVMSTLSELNVVATEVVRTIVDRASTYGRISMIDSLGHYIRMEILGLSLTSLGFFSLFFINVSQLTGYIIFSVILILGGLMWFIYFIEFRKKSNNSRKDLRNSLIGLVFVALSIYSLLNISKISLIITISLSVVGIIMAIYYLIRLINWTFKVFSKSDRKIAAVKSFFLMHSPILVSGLILVAIITTLLGSVHIEDGQISVEPASGNLVIGHQMNNNTIDVRGPYTIEPALENGSSSLLMPQNALNTLELNYGDSIYIDDNKYTLNQTQPGEDNIMRLPTIVRSTLNFNVGDILRDSDVRNRFANLYAVSFLDLDPNFNNTNNLSVTEGVFIQPNDETGRTVDIYYNNQHMAATSGILQNGTYGVYIDGVLYDNIYYNTNSSTDTYYAYSGSSVIKIVIGPPVPSDMEFTNTSTGEFINLVTS